MVTEWINRFRERNLENNNPVVDEFRCQCDPNGRIHTRMISGALRNMNHSKFWLEDGIPVNDL